MLFLLLETIDTCCRNKSKTRAKPKHIVYGNLKKSEAAKTTAEEKEVNEVYSDFWQGVPTSNSCSCRGLVSRLSDY